MTDFVHLHVHTEYSLLDGLSTIKRLLNKIKDLEMQSCAITDHGAMYGCIDFYKYAKKIDIKPIIGIEAYITDSKNFRESDKNSKNFHLLLLAKNIEGYKNLMKLSSIAHIEGYYYKPRFDKETLKKYSKGLICTSSCPLGEIPQLIINNEYEKSKTIAEWYLDLFGEDFYLEIQRHQYKDYLKNSTDSVKTELMELDRKENIINKELIKLSRNLGIPIIATNDSHYINKEDAVAQDVLICISTGKTIDNKNRLRFVDSPTFYIKSKKEMSDLFFDIPDAIDNTIKVSEKCNLEIDLGKWYFPDFPVTSEKNLGIYLKNISKKYLKKHFSNITQDIKNRLNYELDIIIKKGYAPYFLIVMDIVSWAKSQGIITNTRGSAAGSLVSYVLGITTVNPIHYYLPFERFLNPSRPSPPDIDLDVSDNRRDDIISYISKKYGVNKVAQVCTFGRMLSRASVRDVARVLGFEYSVGDKIAKLIPPPKQGFPVTIQTAINEVQELDEIYKNDKNSKNILDMAMQIEGNARHISVHAAGVVVSPKEITEYTPIQKEPSGNKIITQYEMHACEDVGLIKFDILGIRNLSILGNSIEIVKKQNKNFIDINKIPLDDKKTFEILGRGETMGVFQLSSPGMTKYLIDLKPNKVEDLMAMVALYRPGPISVIPEYIKRKRNPKLIKYLDKRMEKFLKESYGLIVYQDDLLFCAIELAGYSWEEADKFRKAVGKKIPEEMASQKDKFIDGIIKHGQTEKFANDLWSLFEPFQSYGFNKAHAASYGIVAYQTAYMKANYPVEYMCALMSAESNDKEKVSQAVEECRRMKINIHPPDINKSNIDFDIENDSKSLNGIAIRFGLSAIKNVGQASINAIIESRNNKHFESIEDFLSRVDGRKVNKKVLESLINVGAFDIFNKRSYLINNIENLKKKYSNTKTPQTQDFLFDNDQIKMASLSKNNTDINVVEYSDEELEAHEKELLGLSLSAKPLSEILKNIDYFKNISISEITSENEYLSSDIKSQLIIAAILRNIKIIITKKSGKEMAFAKVQDITGSIDAIFFPSIYEKYKSVIKENLPYIFEGTIDNRNDKNSFIVESVRDGLSDQNVYINIPMNITSEKLKLLKKYFLSIPGCYKVILQFNKSKFKNIIVDQKINWDKTIAAEIDSIINDDININ